MIMMKRNYSDTLQRRLIGILLPALITVSYGQTKSSQTSPDTKTVAAAAPNIPGKPAQPSPQINSGQAVYLVRSTLMMLNDANRSGNYTVLRDLAAPAFQHRNSAADLAQIFSDLRSRKFDLFAVSFAAPQFNPEPSLEADGKMHLAGFFPTRPLQIKFDLTFQSVDGQWKLFAIAVATPAAPKQQSQLSRPPSPQRTAKPFYGFQLYRGTAGWRW